MPAGAAPASATRLGSSVALQFLRVVFVARHVDKRFSHQISKIGTSRLWNARGTAAVSIAKPFALSFGHPDQFGLAAPRVRRLFGEVLAYGMYFIVR